MREKSVEGVLVPTGSEGWEEAINLPALHMSQRRI